MSERVALIGKPLRRRHSPTGFAAWVKESFTSASPGARWVYAGDVEK